MSSIPPGPKWFDESYDAFPRIEEAFHAALDESLEPRGPERLYDLVRAFDLAPGSFAVDIGCGEGRHTFALAQRFGLDVVGVDPLPRHVELANAELAAVAARDPELARHIRFEPGSAEALPFVDGAAALVWCRDVLGHVADLDRVYAEFRRVLTAGGRGVVYQMFSTHRLEPNEAEWLWRTMGVFPTSADPAQTEEAITTAGLRIDDCVRIGSDWGEWAEEQSGKSGRRLLYAARLLRDPDRYIAQFGRPAYGIMLGDCLWHVYAMIGKIERRAYVLSHDA